MRILVLVILLLCSTARTWALEPGAAARQIYSLQPIGTVEKEGGRTFIVLADEYQPGLLGLDGYSHVVVVYWFHRNDNPEDRAILQVHPRGDPANPIRGVFATRAPLRPNLIAISRCRILSVKGNLVEIDGIDAFDGSPVLDLKNDWQARRSGARLGQTSSNTRKKQVFR